MDAHGPLTVASALGRADAWLGDAIERTVQAHHRRRLGRLGWAHLLDAQGAGWVTAAPPPRPGSSVEVLIDGGAALSAIAAAIDGARHRVHVAGWHVDPGFTMTREGGARTVREVLAAAAERVEVRVLVWRGAPGPLPVFHPLRSEVRRGRHQLVDGTRIQCALDGRERPLHCHHEKLVIVDDEVAFVGGIDLTGLQGDRLDWPGHPARPGGGWHDMAVRVGGPLVADVADHFALRWTTVTGEVLSPAHPAPAQAGGIEAQLVRTIPEHRYPGVDRGDFGVLAAHLGALRGARRLIHLESQFLWLPEITGILRDRLAHPPGDDFRVVIILPEHPDNGGDDTKGQLSVLHDADAGRGNLLCCSISTPDAEEDAAVYVHAKLAIVDDRWMCLGSANLNAHSFFNDTEVGVVTNDPSLAKDTRERLWAEHLGLPVEAVHGDPTHVVDTVLRPVAEEQARRRSAGIPATRPLVLLPSSTRRISRLLGPLDGLLVDG